MISFKGAHFVQDIILTCVRCYLAYPLSYRQVEELMQERGESIDHATINRWVLKYSSQLEDVPDCSRLVGKDVDLTKVSPGDGLTAQCTEAVAILVEKS